ncbi:MAG: hypothetical protein ACKVPX_05095 [Myxococcaceae bacterium]
MNPFLVTLLLAAAPITPASLKAYKGPDGERVVVVRLAAPNEKDAFVQVSGTDSALDGKTLKVEAAQPGDSDDLATYDLVKGRYVVLTRRGDVWSIHLPAPKNRSVSLKYDDALTRESNADAVIKAYKPKL